MALREAVTNVIRHAEARAVLHRAPGPAQRRSAAPGRRRRARGRFRGGLGPARHARAPVRGRRRAGGARLVLRGAADRDAAAPGGRMIRVVVAEDQALVLDALAALLALEDDIEVVGRARDGASGPGGGGRRWKPDVLVSDIEMPRPDRHRRRRAPEGVGEPDARGDRHHLRPRGLSAPRPRRRGAGAICSRTGRARSWPTRCGRSRRAARPSRPNWPKRCGTPRPIPLSERERVRAAHGGGRRVEQGDRRGAGPVARHGAELPVRSRPETGGRQPDRGRPDRAVEWVAITDTHAIKSGSRSTPARRLQSRWQGGGRASTSVRRGFQLVRHRLHRMLKSCVEVPTRDPGGSYGPSDAEKSL